MEFTSYLETTNEFDANDVVKAFQECIELGMEELRKKGDDLGYSIMHDFWENGLNIERE